MRRGGDWDAREGPKSGYDDDMDGGGYSTDEEGRGGGAGGGSGGRSMSAEDELRDALRAAAQEAGVPIPDFVRDILAPHAAGGGDGGADGDGGDGKLLNLAGFKRGLKSVPEVSRLFRSSELESIFDDYGPDKKTGTIPLSSVVSYLSEVNMSRLRRISERVRDAIMERFADMGPSKFSSAFQAAARGSDVLTAGRLQDFVIDMTNRPITQLDAESLLSLMDMDGDMTIRQDDFLGYFSESAEDLLARALDSEQHTFIVDVQMSVTRTEELQLKNSRYRPLANQSGMGTFGRNLTLWYRDASLGTAGGRLKPIVDIVLSSSQVSSDLVIAGFTCLGQNIGKGGVSSQWLWMRRASSVTEEKDAIQELHVSCGRMKEATGPLWTSPGVGWVRVDGNFAKGATGNDYFLWFLPARPRSTDSLAQLRGVSTLSPDRKRQSLVATARRAIRSYVPSIEVHNVNEAFQEDTTGSHIFSAFNCCTLFNKYDTSDRGLLSKSQFEKLLREVGINVNKADLAALMHRFDCDADGHVSRNEFVSFVALNAHELDELVGMIRKKFAAEGSRVQVMQIMWSAFEHLDEDEDGLLNDVEIMKMCAQLGVYLMESEVHAIKNIMDQPRDDRVDADDFVRFVLSEETAVSRRACRVRDAADALRRWILQSQSDRKKVSSGNDVDSVTAWDELKRKHSQAYGGRQFPGYLTSQDLSLCVQRLGIYLSLEEGRQLAMLVSPLQNGRVNYTDFHAFACASLRSIGELLKLVEDVLMPNLIDSYRAYRRFVRERHASGVAHGRGSKRGGGGGMDGGDRGGGNERGGGRRENDDDMRDFGNEYNRLLQQAMRAVKGDVEGLDRISVDKIRSGLMEFGRYDEAESPSEREWAALAMLVGAEDHSSDDVLGVYPKPLLNGLMEHIVGPLDGKTNRPGDGTEVELDVVCRDLQRLLRQEGIKLAAHASGDKSSRNGGGGGRGSGGRDELRLCYDTFDLDGNGQIPMDEFRGILKRYGIEALLSESEIQTLLGRFDTEGKGHITFEDFRAFVTTRDMAEASRRMGATGAAGAWNDPAHGGGDRSNAMLNAANSIGWAQYIARQEQPPTAFFGRTVTDVDRMLWLAYRELVLVNPHSALTEFQDMMNDICGSNAISNEDGGGSTDPGGSGSRPPSAAANPARRVGGQGEFATGIRTRERADSHGAFAPAVQAKAVWRAFQSRGLVSDTLNKGVVKNACKLLLLPAQQQQRNASALKNPDTSTTGIAFARDKNDQTRESVWEQFIDVERLQGGAVRMVRQIKSHRRDRLGVQDKDYAILLENLKRELRNMAIVTTTGGARYTFEKVFRQMDRDNDGSLSVEEFVHALQSMQLSRGWSPRVVRRLFQDFDDNNDERISIEEFEAFVLSDEPPPSLRALMEEQRRLQHEQAFAQMGADGLDDDLFGPSEEQLALWRRVRAACKKQRAIGGEDKRKMMERWFAAKDVHNTGRVPIERFDVFVHRSLLEEELPARDVRALRDLLARDNRDGSITDTIDYRKFITFVHRTDLDQDPNKNVAAPAKAKLPAKPGGAAAPKPVPMPLTSLLSRVANGIAAANQRGVNPHALFVLCDKNKRGAVSKEDFMHNMKVMDVPLTRDESQMLVDQLPRRTDQLVDYGELFSLLLRFYNPRAPSLGGLAAPGAPGTGPYHSGYPGVAGAGAALPSYATPGVTTHISSQYPFGVPPDGSAGFPGPLFPGAEQSTPFGASGGAAGGWPNAPWTAMTGYTAGGPAMPPGLGSMVVGESDGAGYDRVLWGVCARVRQAEKERVNRFGEFRLQKIFEAYDTDSTGFVQQRVFISQLEELGVFLSPVEANYVLSRYGRVTEGLVDYVSFCRAVSATQSAPESVELLRAANAIRDRLRDLHREQISVSAAFQAEDRDSTGFVATRDFREVVGRLKLPVTETQLREIFRKFSSVGDPNLIGYENVLDWFERIRVGAECSTTRYHKPMTTASGSGALSDPGSPSGPNIRRMRRSGRKSGKHSHAKTTKQQSMRRQWEREREFFNRTHSGVPSSAGHRVDSYTGDVSRLIVDHADHSRRDDFLEEEKHDSDRHGRRPHHHHSSSRGRSKYDSSGRRIYTEPRYSDEEDEEDDDDDDEYSTDGRLRENAQDAGFALAGGGISPRMTLRDGDRQTATMHTSPVKQIGARVWGSRTPLEERGQSPFPAQDSEAFGTGKAKWYCPVCFYSENPGSAPNCTMCRTANPHSGAAGGDGPDGDSVVRCPNCTHQNPAFARECEMCRECLTDLDGAPAPIEIGSDGEAMEPPPSASSGASSPHHHRHHHHHHHDKHGKSHRHHHHHHSHHKSGSSHKQKDGTHGHHHHHHGKHSSHGKTGGGSHHKHHHHHHHRHSGTSRHSTEDDWALGSDGAESFAGRGMPQFDEEEFVARSPASSSARRRQRQHQHQHHNGSGSRVKSTGRKAGSAGRSRSPPRTRSPRRSRSPARRLEPTTSSSETEFSAALSSSRQRVRHTGSPSKRRHRHTTGRSPSKSASRGRAHRYSDDDESKPF